MTSDPGARGSTSLELGVPAPDFTLSNQFGEPITLSSLRGQNVVLVFYPFAFSGICTEELCEVRDNAEVFERAGIRLLAISVDSKYALRAYAQTEGFAFDLLADFWPHGGVSKLFGAFDADRGMASRSTFVIDSRGILQDSFSTPVGTARALSRYEQALALLVQ